MTLDEIKQAVRNGATVHWATDGYSVVRSEMADGAETFDIVARSNGHTIGLTWVDGVTMNGRPEEFYVLRSGVDPTLGCLCEGPHREFCELKGNA